ncbi:MAG: hypothetical protein K0R61_5718 [Microvirga sp.]|nr:hypothetical protein [Microvirga sp.]
MEPAGRPRVVIGIGVDLEARGLEELAVVLPARIADPHLRPRLDELQEVRADFQAAGAAQRLHGDDALGLLAENECLHRAVVGREAVDRQIAARCRAFQALAFRVAHAL